MPITHTKIKVFHPNSKKLDKTIRHAFSEPCLRAMQKVLGLQEQELQPVKEATQFLEKTTGEGTVSFMLANRRVRVERVLQ